MALVTRGVSAHAFNLIDDHPTDYGSYEYTYADGKLAGFKDLNDQIVGSVLTKLKANGGKDITYVPANGLVSPMQMPDQPYSSPPSYMRWVTRDPLGIQESNNGYVSAYDPFGNLISNVQPPLGGTPPYIPFYGASYGGLSANSFTNANNLAAGCNIGGAPIDCNRAMIGAMGLAFASNLPGFHLDNLHAEASHASNFVIRTRRWVSHPDGVPVSSWSGRSATGCRSR